MGVYDILERVSKGDVKIDKDMEILYPFVSLGITFASIFILRDKYKVMRARYYDKSIHGDDSRIDDSRISHG